MSNGGLENRIGSDDPDVRPIIEWTPSDEHSFCSVIEVHRRFNEVFEDTRTAAALTMAWAAITAGRLAHPE